MYRPRNRGLKLVHQEQHLSALLAAGVSINEAAERAGMALETAKRWALDAEFQAIVSEVRKGMATSGRNPEPAK